VVFQKNPLAVGDNPAARGAHKKFWIEFYMSFRMDMLNVFIFFSIYVHPVDKNRVVVDPHGGQEFFQSAREVGEFLKPALAPKFWHLAQMIYQLAQTLC
jgi:hypothetical protein